MKTFDVILLFIRFLFIFTPGYIHPDEFFQSIEVISGDVLSIDHFRSWEFNSSAPLRSVAAPVTLRSGFICGLPCAIIKLLRVEDGLASVLLIVLPRLLLFGLSFIHDLAILRLGTALSKDTHDRWMGKSRTADCRSYLRLCVLRTSWAFLVFSCRTFSNSIEALLLSGALFLPRTHSSGKRCTNAAVIRPGWRQAAGLGVVVALGVWTRFTFLFFVAPIALAVLLDMLPVITCRNLLRAAILVFVALYSFLTSALTLALIDTIYYAPKPLAVSSLTADLRITPWNNLIYNSDPANLAEHGLHPRFTHLLVNLPMLLGPVPLLVAISLRSIRGSRLTVMLTGIAAIGLAMLSIAPHQEPRFLLPLVLPIIAIAPTTYFRKRWFWAVWIAFNVALMLVWGVLHQGGVIPSLLLRSHSDPASHHLIYSHTYMPPRSLLFQGEVRTTVHDLSGASGDTLWTFIRSLNATAARDASISIVQPGSLPAPLGLAPVACYWPHLATEDLSLAAFRSSPLRALSLCEYVLRSSVQ